MNTEKKKGFMSVVESTFPSTSKSETTVIQLDGSGAPVQQSDSWIVRNAKPSKLPYVAYGVGGLALAGGFVMIAPMLFTAVGYLVGAAIGASLLGGIYAMRKPIATWAKFQGIKAHRRIVEANPIEHLTLERNRAAAEQEEVQKSIQYLVNESNELLHKSRDSKKRIEEDKNKLNVLKSHLEEVKTKLDNLVKTEDYDLGIFSNLEKKKQVILLDIRKIINNIKRNDELIVKFGVESKTRREASEKFQKFAVHHSDRVAQLDATIKELQEDLKLNKSGLRVTEIVKRLEDLGRTAEFNWSLDSAKEQIKETKAKLDANIKSLDDKILTGGKSIEYDDSYIENELTNILGDIDSGKVGSANPERYLSNDIDITSDEEYISSKRSYNQIRD